MKTFKERVEELKEKYYFHLKNGRYNISGIYKKQAKALKEEIESKGCGRMFQPDTLDEAVICIHDYEGSDAYQELEWCPTCQSLIKQLEEIIE